MTQIQDTSRLALITGANRGIGFEVARQLGQQDIQVLIGARSLERGQEAVTALTEEGIKAQAIELDVTQQNTIEAAADYIQTQFGRLDILVNNAGIMLDHQSPVEVDIDTLLQTYDTNVFGSFRVTKAMLPLLRQAAAGRVVNLSTSLASLAFNSDPNFKFAHLKHLAYNSSKTALNAITVQLAYDLRATAIKVNAADPGYTATDFNNYQGTRTVQQGAAIVVRLATLPEDGPSGGFFNEAGPIPW